VGRELCGSRRLCVSMATMSADRYVNGIFFLSERKSWRALNPTKREKLIPKIANLRQSGLTSMHLCSLWGAQNRCVLSDGLMDIDGNETVALVKSGNVKRHYETKHAHFEQKYPQNSKIRGRKINHLQSYQATCSVIVRSATKQERVYLNIYQNQNHVYWPSTFSYTRNLFWV